MKGFDTKPDTGSYLESYSLSCEPFADSIDNRFFYGGTTLMQRLDLLSHLTQFGESVVFVSGPTGSGKTTLLSRFVSQANSQWHMCLMNADEFDHFPARLADLFKIEASANEQELLSKWAAQTDNSQLLVIVIDNSEQLDDPALERLCALLGQTAANNRIRLILFGTPEAQQAHKQTFEQKQLECSTQLLEMPRMSEEETASYLVYRLSVAGYSGENPFTATEIRAICKASDGRPSNINRLARQALQEHHARAGSKRMRVRQDTHKNSSLTWGLATAGILALAIWLGWQKLYPPPADEIPVTQAPMEERPLAIPEPTALAIPAVTTPTPNETPVSAETSMTEQQHEGPEPEAAPLATTLPANPNAERAELAIPNVTTEAPSTSDVTNEAPPAVVTPQQPTPLAIQKAPEPATIAIDKDIVKSTGSQLPVDIPAPDTVAEHAPAPEPLPHRESWLLAQPETSFSLQLLGSRNAESIVSYIQQHRLDIQQSAFYKGMHKGAEWYVLLYGIYPSRQAATDARAALPASIRSEKPWPRTLKTVHSAIREAQ